MNYRGSSGRGERFQQRIAADWGDLEVQDLLAMVDKAVAMGVADPRRLGVGGWSYGAILTDYLIASTNRFRAATSGAGTGTACLCRGLRPRRLPLVGSPRPRRDRPSGTTG
ncbi:MAG: prolyl oligopeptidase family serine peptidase [Terriglobales bacterium]